MRSVREAAIGEANEMYQAYKDGVLEDWLDENMGGLIDFRKIESARFDSEGRIVGYSFSGLQINYAMSPTLVIDTFLNRLVCYDASNETSVGLDNEMCEAIEDYFGFGY